VGPQVGPRECTSLLGTPRHVFQRRDAPRFAPQSGGRHSGEDRTTASGAHAADLTPRLGLGASGGRLRLLDSLRGVGLLVAGALERLLGPLESPLCALQLPFGLSYVALRLGHLTPLGPVAGARLSRYRLRPRPLLALSSQTHRSL